ncbi:VWA domain-containing protein [Clostridioides difficile]
MKFDIGNLYFLILIPILIFFIYYSVKKFKNNNKNEVLILISRIVIFTLMLLSFANITISIKGKNISTVFLLDVSESISSFKDSGESFINSALEIMPKGNKAGVILFGDNSKVDKVIDNKKLYKGLSSTPINTATNIQAAVESAITLFEDGTSKRIVLITDGEENKGDILKSIPLINAENIDLKVYKVTDEIGNEIYVDNVTIPDNISIGEEFSVQIDLESNYATAAKLTLFSGREKVGEQTVEVKKGSNSFIFRDVQSSGGFKSYRVTVEAEGDINKVNNEYSAYTNVVDKPNILIINGVKGDATALEGILKNGGANIKTISPASSPSTLNELLEYKSIVLNNVYKDDLTNGFMDNIESYVKDYGGGVVTFGGEDSYALGGYKDTALERILPVNMDKKGKNEVPSISINLIIDKSGSMSAEGGGVSKLTLAKEAAMKALDNLREIDDISVIAFDDTYDVVVPTQKVTDKDYIKELISGIQIRGGTSIYPALEKGYNLQLESNAKIKHTILLTDGQDSIPYSTYEQLLDKFKNDNISISTVAVGSDSNSGLLTQLAESCNGRSYYTDIYTDIPRIFAQEVLMSVGTYIINEEFTPSIVSNHEVLAGVQTSEGIPSLLGYIGTSLKDDAIEILSSNRDEPILAVRQYGIGKTVSFTSDIDGSWSGNYLTWEYGPQLIKNMVYYSIPTYGEEGHLSINQDGNEAKVEFYNDNVTSNTKVTGVYTGEDGSEGEFTLTQSEPGKFEANIPLSELGFYNFSIRQQEGEDITSTYKGAFALKYSDEYKFNTNSIKLDSLVSETNGSFINKVEEVFVGKLEKEYKKINLTNPLLIIVLFLFLFDIAYRRLNLDFSKYINKKNKRAVKKDKVKAKDIAKDELAVEKQVNNTSAKTEVEEKISNKKTEKKSKIKKSKKSVETPKSNTLDTSALLKKKNDRNGV